MKGDHHQEEELVKPWDRRDSELLDQENDSTLEAEVNETNTYLNNEKEIPDWLGRGRTELIPKSYDLTKTD